MQWCYRMSPGIGRVMVVGLLLAASPMLAMAQQAAPAAQTSQVQATPPQSTAPQAEAVNPPPAATVHGEGAVPSEAQGHGEAQAHSEAAGHKNPWDSILYPGINFVVLMALLVYFIRKPVKAYTTANAQHMKEMIDDLRRAEAEAKAALAEERAKLKRLDAELASMRAEVAQEAANEKARLTQEAQQLAERLLEQVKQQVALEQSKAMDALRHELADATIELAQKAIRQQMDTTKQQKLVADFTRQLEASK